jgi:hypothetical protein
VSPCRRWSQKDPAFFDKGPLLPSEQSAMLTWLRPTTWAGTSTRTVTDAEENTRVKERYLVGHEIGLSQDLCDIIDEYAAEDRLYCIGREEAFLTYERLRALDALLGTRFPLDRARINNRARWVLYESDLIGSVTRPLCALPPFNELHAGCLALFSVRNEVWVRDIDTIHVYSRDTFQWRRVPHPPRQHPAAAGALCLAYITGRVYSVDAHSVCKWQHASETWHVLWSDMTASVLSACADTDGRTLWLVDSQSLLTFDPKIGEPSRVLDLPCSSVYLSLGVRVASGHVILMSTGPARIMYLWRIGSEPVWQSVPTLSPVLGLSNMMVFNGDVILSAPASPMRHRWDWATHEWKTCGRNNRFHVELLDSLATSSAVLPLRPLAACRAMHTHTGSAGAPTSSTTSSVLLHAPHAPSPLERETHIRKLALGAMSTAAVVGALMWTGWQIRQRGVSGFMRRLSRLVSPNTVVANWGAIVNVLQMVGLAVLCYATVC